MSIRRKMGLEDDVYTGASRIIILKFEQKDALGIVVDEVKEVINLDLTKLTSRRTAQGKQRRCLSTASEKTAMSLFPCSISMRSSASMRQYKSRVWQEITCTGVSLWE